MHRCLSAMICLFLLPFIAASQKQKEHSVQAGNVSFAFGARAGAAIANIDASYNDYYSSKSRTGFYLGLVYHLPISRSWAFQPEAYFGQQGAIVTHSAADPDLPAETEIPVRLSYLHVPLKLAYLHPSGFSLQTGPQFSLLLSSNDYNQKDADVAWVFGAAYLSQSGFGIEVRYNWGISVITGSETFYYDYARDERNRVLQLGLVYFFAIAKKR